MSLNRKDFGKHLAYLRKQAGLSQFDCANALGVSDKAISKWETGSAYPNVETLEKLSSLFGISLSTLFSQFEEPRKNYFTLAVTGGPCAGKSVAVELLCEFFQQRGWQVFVECEAATALINAGFLAFGSVSTFDFQRRIFSLQLAFEDALFERANESAALRLSQKRHPDVNPCISCPSKTIVIVDRGIPDGGAYLSPADNARLMQMNNMTLDEIFARYDGVILLESAASGSFGYTLDNNPARQENQQEAYELDLRIRDAWVNHPHTAFVHAEESFELKLLNVIAAACSLVGELPPHALTPNLSFLIKKPDENALSERSSIVRETETFTFLEPRHAKRLVLVERHRNNTVTHAVLESDPSLNEPHGPQTPLSPDEYRNLMLFADPAYKQVTRTTLRFMHENVSFAAHFYDYYPYVAVLDIDAPANSASRASISLPPFISKVREITDGETFSVRAIARALAQGRL